MQIYIYIYIYIFSKFLAQDNDFPAFWLVHSILVISSYTLVWPYMVNDWAKHCYAKNVLARKRNFSLNKAKKRKKNLFVESLDQCWRLEVREKARNVVVMSVCLSDHKVLHNIASSSSFFRFCLDFLAFFALLSYLKCLEFKEFNKTIIIPFALVGYETGYSHYIYHLISNAHSWNNC